VTARWAPDRRDEHRDPLRQVEHAHAERAAGKRGHDRILQLAAQLLRGRLRDQHRLEIADARDGLTVEGPQGDRDPLMALELGLERNSSASSVTDDRRTLRQVLIVRRP
jgi:hypothetical protein